MMMMMMLSVQRNVFFNECSRSPAHLRAFVSFVDFTWLVVTKTNLNSNCSLAIVLLLLFHVLLRAFLC
jgi:hypothetical protein